MAKIQEIAAVIGESLRLPPAVIQSHVNGLREAERISTEDDDGIASADILAACLCTDPDNATGAFHLPFIGGYAYDASSRQIAIEPGTSNFQMIQDMAPTLGDGLAYLIRDISAGGIPPDCVNHISVSGAGSRLRASLGMRSTYFGGDVTAYFGNLPLWDHLRVMAAYPGYIERSALVGGQVLSALGDLMSGLPFTLQTIAVPREQAERWN